MRLDPTHSHSSFHRATAAVLLMVFTIFSMPLRARANVDLNSILPANSATLRETLVTSIERLLKSFYYKNTFAAEAMRNPRVPNEIHVHSNSTGLAVGQQQQLTALAVDPKGETVDGLGFSWSSNNPTIAEISQSGTIRALAPGDVEVTASSGSIQGSIRLRVSSVEERIVPSPQPVSSSLAGKSFGSPSKKIAPVSSSSGRTVRASLFRKGTKALRVYAFPVCSGGDCSPPAPNNQAAPQANVGKPLNAPQTLTTESESTIYPGSSNFNKTFPIASLTGRGENGVVLAAFYNSQPWVYESGTGKYSYNTNWDWPGPGFNLHFGKLNWQTVGGTTQYLLITPDGTRHTLVSTGTTGKLQTNDGTFILVTTPQIGPSYIAHFPDGTVVTYDVAGPNNYQYASRVQDRNGNFATITYTATIP